MLWGLLLVTVCVQFIYAQEHPCQNVTCDPTCSYGLKKDKLGCDTCECLERECVELDCMLGTVCRVFNLSQSLYQIAVCADPELPEACQQPLDAGMCSGNVPKVFYAADTDSCEEFAYSGCGGNQNLFDSRLECDTHCRPDKVGIKPGCTPISCTMLCEEGFRLDENGCKTCECDSSEQNGGTDPGIFVVGPGCDEDMKFQCLISCPHGFKQDNYGCSICECKEPPGCRTSMDSCGLCPFGYKRDDKGCLTCQCKSGCDVMDCGFNCFYGFEVDGYGCPICSCKVDPCKAVYCDEGTMCQPVNTTGGWFGRCVTEPSGYYPDCPQVSCMKHCENGFKTDKHGCELCICRDPQPIACPMLKCRQCQYGYAFDENGCQTCECLDNPCSSKKCQQPRVCEIRKDYFCPLCPPRGVCILPEEVQRVSISLDVIYTPVNDLDMEALSREMKRVLLKAMGNNDTDIIQLELHNKDDNTISLYFDLIGSDRLVEVSETFRAQLLVDNNANWNLMDTDFFVQPDSLQTDYCILPADFEPQRPVDLAPKQTGLYVIIACAVGGAVILLVAIAALAVMRSRKPPPKRRKNIIYKKTPTDDRNIKVPMTIA